MPPQLKNSWLFIITLALIILFTPAFANLYEQIIGHKIAIGFIGLSHPEYFEGFFMSYSFFVTLILVIFIRHKKYKILGIYLGILLLLNIISNTWESLFINISTVMIAIIIAQIILLIFKKFKK